MPRGSLAPSATLILLAMAALGAPVWGQVCEVCPPNGRLGPSTEVWSPGFGGPEPRCGPLLEDTPHWNLYWFQCASRVVTCDQIVPPLMSRTPRWYAMAEFVPLTRDSQGSRTFATFGDDAPAPLAGTTALSTEDFDHEFAGGGRFLLGRQLGEWYRFEVSYLGAYNFEDDAAIRDATANTPGGTGTLTSPFTDFGDPETLGLDFNELAQISIASSFNSIEFNLRRKVVLPTQGVEASFLLGGRYMQIDEEFGYRAEANVPAAMGAINEVGVVTDNKLIGIQLGMLLQFYQTSRAWIDLDLKGGIFQNMASQNSIYNNTDADGLLTTFTGGDDEMRTSFAGELLLAANYNFSRTLTLRVGYQATALTGVALAEENFQSNQSLLTLGPAELDHDGEVVYHGPVIGLTWVR